VKCIGDMSQVICLNMIYDTTVFFDFLTHQMHPDVSIDLVGKSESYSVGGGVELTPRRLVVLAEVPVLSFAKSFRTNNAIEPQRMSYAFPVLYFSLFTHHCESL
jgi:hypothetical protein